jgi:hypothetical protein
MNTNHNPQPDRPPTLAESALIVAAFSTDETARQNAAAILAETEERDGERWDGLS